MKEFKIGNSKIIMNDKYCRNQTADERAEIFRRVSRIAYGALRRQAPKKEIRQEKAAGI